MASNPNNVIITGNDPGDETSLLDILDHVLNAGVIIRGNLVISLAGVDLIYVGLDVILTSVETALRQMNVQNAPKLHT
jgi:gas vesicle structural protein